PDEEYRLEFKEGTVALGAAQENRSGFAWFSRLFKGEFGDGWQKSLPLALGLLFVGALLLRLAAKEGTRIGSKNQWLGAGFGLMFCAVVIVMLVSVAVFAVSNRATVPLGLNFAAPIQEAGQMLAVQLTNVSARHWTLSLWTIWPALLGLALWFYVAAMAPAGFVRRAGSILG